MPREIVLKLNAAMSQVVASPAFVQRFAVIGDEPGGGTADLVLQVIQLLAGALPRGGGLLQRAELFVHAGGIRFEHGRSREVKLPDHLLGRRVTR